MINTFNEEREAIESHFKQKWGKASKILWENSRVKPPASGEFVRLNILQGAGSQISIGPTQLHRTESQVQLQIFGEKGKGKKKVLELADYAEELFTNLQLDSIQFRSAYIINVGEVSEWYQLNVVCPFYRNRIKN
jgi:hypothetical protein